MVNSDYYKNTSNLKQKYSSANNNANNKQTYTNTKKTIKQGNKTTGIISKGLKRNGKSIATAGFLFLSGLGLINQHQKIQNSDDANKANQETVQEIPQQNQENLQDVTELLLCYDEEEANLTQDIAHMNARIRGILTTAGIDLQKPSDSIKSLQEVLADKRSEICIGLENSLDSAVNVSIELIKLYNQHIETAFNKAKEERDAGNKIKALEHIEYALLKTDRIMEVYQNIDSFRQSSSDSEVLFEFGRQIGQEISILDALISQLAQHKKDLLDEIHATSGNIEQDNSSEQHTHEPATQSPTQEQNNQTHDRPSSSNQGTSEADRSDQEQDPRSLIQEEVLRWNPVQIVNNLSEGNHQDILKPIDAYIGENAEKYKNGQMRGADKTKFETTLQAYAKLLLFSQSPSEVMNIFENAPRSGSKQARFNNVVSNLYTEYMTINLSDRFYLTGLFIKNRFKVKVQIHSGSYLLDTEFRINENDYELYKRTHGPQNNSNNHSQENQENSQNQSESSNINYQDMDNIKIEFDGVAMEITPEQLQLNNLSTVTLSAPSGANGRNIKIFKGSSRNIAEAKHRDYQASTAERYRVITSGVVGDKFLLFTIGN